MTERMIAEVMIDECDGCGVLWFDRGELEVYRKKYYTKEIDSDVLFNQFKEFNEISGRNCPKCGSDKFMMSEKDKDVIGRCSRCYSIFFSKRIIDKSSSRKDKIGTIATIIDALQYILFSI